MLGNDFQPPDQRGFESSNNSLFPSFSYITKENLGPFRRVLCRLLAMGAHTTATTYDGTKSKCEDL